MLDPHLSQVSLLLIAKRLFIVVKPHKPFIRAQEWVQDLHTYGGMGGEQR